MPLSPDEVQDLAQRFVRFVRCRRLADEAAASEIKLRDEAQALADALREPMEHHPVIVLHDPAGAMVLSLVDGGIDLQVATVLGHVERTIISGATTTVVHNAAPQASPTPAAEPKPGRTRKAKGVETAATGPSATVPVGEPLVLKPTGFICSVCGLAQFASPSGDSCHNGHAGAQPMTLDQWNAARAADGKPTPAPAASEGMELPGQAPAVAVAAPPAIKGIDSKTLRAECQRVAMLLSSKGQNGEALVTQALGGVGISRMDPANYQKGYDAVRALAPVSP